MFLGKGYVGIVLIVVLLLASHKSDAISVKPSLCPTNKIAPHRRILVANRARTFGYISELFNDDGLQNDSPAGSLQEDPQQDDPEDCGDIEDYDENDLSAISPTGQRRETSGYVENRFFFGQNFFGRPPQNPNPTGPQYPNRPPRPPNGGNIPTRPPQPYPTRPPQPYPTRPPQPYPTRPPQQYPTKPPQQYPTRPPRPPYSSGGFFSGNQYRPPYDQYPSDNIKPVYESDTEQLPTYRPGIVGGPSGHVVGVPARPSRPQYDEAPTTRKYQVYDQRPQPKGPEYPTRRERPARKLNNDSVIGSFFGLLFK